MKTSTIISASLGFAGVNSLQSAYQQCGGSGFSGETACVAGFTCKSNNQYYSQCVPGTASAAVTSTARVTSTTHSTLVVKASSTASNSLLVSTKALSSSAAGFAKVDGAAFNFNGKTQHFAGTNTYYISFLSNKADVDQIMAHLKETGLKVLRVWGFNDVTAIPAAGQAYFQSFVSGKDPVINTGADGIQRLDYVVKSAEANGISLIIPLVNYWDDFGGMAAYASYYGIKKTEWYTSAAAQAQYQKFVAAVVSRYAKSTAIFAWELANEPRCNGCATTVITEWATKTSAYIKSLDANHMVTLGDEGFGLKDTDTSYPFQFGEGIDWAANLAIKTLDFGTIHLYPEHWGQTASWGSYWIEAHAKAATAAGKPFIVEEYGHSIKSELGPWQKTILSSKTAGDLYWQYGETLSTGITSDDGFAIYFGSSDYKTYVTAHAAAMAAKV